MQTLDGVGAGLFGALFPMIVADLMGGTGRYNVAHGAMMTAQGTGASLSTTLAGIVVVEAGYSAAFLTLAAVALRGCTGFLLRHAGDPGVHPSEKSGGGQSQEPARASTVVLHPIA